MKYCPISQEGGWGVGGAYEGKHKTGKHCSTPPRCRFMGRGQMEVTGGTTFGVTKKDLFTPWEFYDFFGRAFSVLLRSDLEKNGKI